MAKKQSKQSGKTVFLKVFWGLAASGFVLALLLFVLIAIGKFGFMPTFEHLENPKTDIATEIYSSDGVLLTTFFLEENRNPVDFKDMPPHLIEALIAREDQRFEEHSGIDGRSLIRVAVKTVLMRKSGEGGGSTITQQLAKQLFKRDNTVYKWKIAQKAHMATIKFREWVIAVRLEKQYTKQEIAMMYLNIVPFVYNAFGVKSASRTFFGKNVNDLTIEESAMLVGMLQRPSYYNPVRHPERTTVRRNSVLNKMVERGYLSKHDYDSISQIPIRLNFERLDHQAGTATYFREYIRLTMSKTEPKRSNYQNPQSFYEDSLQWHNNPLFGWCNKNLRSDGTPFNLYTDGLKIFTTIDSRMQIYAEESMKKHLIVKQKEFNNEKKGRKKAPFAETLTDKEIDNIMNTAIRQSERYRVLSKSGKTYEEILENFNVPCEMIVFSWNGDRDTVMTPMDSIRYYKSILRSSMMAMDPHTGEVKVYVGGINFRHFKWDGVKSQKRQVGSTFKPILYTQTFQERRDLTPCHEVLNQTYTFKTADTVWSPRSSGNQKYINSYVSLKWGLAMSENNITAWLLKQTSPEAVVDMAHKMGIVSHIDPVPSIVLGSTEISVAEMTAAFSVFSNSGVYVEPVFVTQIKDKNGNVLEKFEPYKREVISEETAFLMVNMLQGVVGGGTASSLRYKYNLRYEMGGKTGTTQNQSDGWYIGITPDLVAGVWVGGEDRGVRFSNMTLGQAAATALPIYGLFMQKVYADRNINLYKGSFREPDNFNIDLNCKSSQIEEMEVYE